MDTTGDQTESGRFHDDARFFEFVRRLGFSPRVVFDIGASTGVWSERMHGFFPEAQYHLFEPLAGHVDDYRANLNSRLERLPGLQVHPTAIGSRTGSQPMFVTHDGYGSSLLDRGGHGKVVEVIKETMDVPVCRLDDYVRGHDLPKPDFIKMDCQGYELEILRGAAECLDPVSILHLETWFSREYGPATPLFSDLTEWLHGREFALIGIGESFVDSQHRLYSMNAFFFSEDLLERCWPHHGGSRVRRRVLGWEDCQGGMDR